MREIERATFEWHREDLEGTAPGFLAKWLQHATVTA